jgi:hypothetical protein
VTGTRTATPTSTRTSTPLPTATATASASPTLPNQGPIVRFFGVLTRVDGCLFCCEQECAGIPTPVPIFDAQGRRIFDTRTGQFLIVVEGSTGPSGLLPGESLQPFPPTNRTDLQIQNTRPMGNGSVQVCDTGPPSAGGGGIPGVNPPSYAETSAITAALNDFACRFEAFTATSPCTQVDATGQPKPIHPETVRQFCDNVSATEVFGPGEHVMTVRLRDVGGNVGPTAQIVVRVATPTPLP